jgi:hypothetical protein
MYLPIILPGIWYTAKFPTAWEEYPIFIVLIVQGILLSGKQNILTSQIFIHAFRIKPARILPRA